MPEFLLNVETPAPHIRLSQISIYKSDVLTKECIEALDELPAG